jgi:hypothetical protein
MDKHSGSVPVNYLNKYSNVITRSIAGSNDKIDIYPNDRDYLQVEEDFTFLLCSDGLILDKSYDYSFFFFEMIKNASSLEQATISLFDWAFNSGSTDNISIAILSNIKDYKRKTETKRSFAILVLFLIVLLLGGGLYYYVNNNNLFKGRTVTVKGSTQKQNINKKTATKKHHWQGFTTTKPLDYKLEGDIDWKWSLNWHEYDSNSNSDYILKIVNNKAPHNTVAEHKIHNRDHITLKDIESNLKSLKPGAYIIELFAETKSGVTSKSPNSVKLNVK